MSGKKHVIADGGGSQCVNCNECEKFFRKLIDCAIILHNEADLVNISTKMRHEISAVYGEECIKHVCDKLRIEIEPLSVAHSFDVSTLNGKPFNKQKEDKVSFADTLREKTEEHFVKDKKQRETQLEEFKKKAKAVMLRAATDGFRMCTLSKTSHNCLVSQKQVQEMANEMGVQMCNNYTEYEFFWYTSEEYEDMKKRVLS